MSLKPAALHILEAVSKPPTPLSSPARCSNPHDSASGIHRSLATSPRRRRQQPQNPHVLVPKRRLGRQPQRLVARCRLRRHRRHGRLPQPRRHFRQRLRRLLRRLRPAIQQALLHRRNRRRQRWVRRGQGSLGRAAGERRRFGLSVL